MRHQIPSKRQLYYDKGFSCELEKIIRTASDQVSENNDSTIVIGRFTWHRCLQLYTDCRCSWLIRSVLDFRLLNLIHSSRELLFTRQWILNLLKTRCFPFEVKKQFPLAYLNPEM